MGRFWLTLALAAAVAGCGLKGPLYLPKDKPAQKQPQKQPQKPSTPVPMAPVTGAGQPS